MRTLRFDKRYPRQRLDAKPTSGAPCKGESGEGSGARVYPSFSATTKKGTQRVPFFVVMKRWFDENPALRSNVTKRAFDTEALSGFSLLISASRSARRLRCHQNKVCHLRLSRAPFS